MVKTTKNHIIILDLKIEKKLLTNKYTEIAELAGLHPSTVWRILNNQRKNINSIIKVKNAIYQLFHNKVTIINAQENTSPKEILTLTSKLSRTMRSINGNTKIS